MKVNRSKCNHFDDSLQMMMANQSTSCALSSDEEVSVGDTVKRKSQCHVTLPDSESNNSEITFRERLKICFKPKYQLRRVNNKGAILVLVWNFLVTLVFYYTIYKYSTPENICPICFKLIPVPVGLALLFTVWLADVYFKRYKIIQWSIIIMWISSLLLTTSFVLEEIVTFTNYYQLVLLLFLGIGYGTFLANIIQFGMDQLTDASMNEILSFINWYVWTYVSSALVTNFTSKCSSSQYKFIAPLILCVALSIVAVSLFLCNNVLIKEPVTQNPFRLIHRVVKYALKHNYARRRSAFTYCEDELPSRLDFGKSKYGGPFTTEQVEDVKTFLRALGLILIVSFTFATKDETDFKIVLLGKTLLHQINSAPFYECAYMFIFTDIYYIAVALLIPLNEIVIHPLFQRCLPSILCHWKIVIGLTLQVVKYILMLIFVSLSRQHYVKITELSSNNTLTPLPCLFFNNSSDFVDNSATIYDFRFYAIPDAVSSLSFMMVFIGAIEFLCAQIPYSMKGVIVALFYGSVVVFFALNKAVTKIYKETSSLWSTGTLFDCGFWYLQTKLLFVSIATLTLILLAVLYKKRKREDVLPNEHIFAERYYSKKLQQIN